MIAFEAYYGFSGTPFERDIKVENLFETAGFKEMQARLCHITQRRSFGVFTGDAGAGKTTAIRKFSEKLDTNLYRVLYVTDSALTPRNFYWETLHQLGYKPHFYRGDAKRQLHKALADMVENDHKSPVVIVDEAHLLSREMLESFS